MLKAVIKIEVLYLQVCEGLRNLTFQRKPGGVFHVILS